MCARLMVLSASPKGPGYDTCKRAPCACGFICWLNFFLYLCRTFFDIRSSPVPYEDKAPQIFLCYLLTLVRSCSFFYINITIMRFAVILSYSGLIQHYWIYDCTDYQFAIDQFNRLNEAFIEVNESQVFLFKIGPIINKARLADLVKQLFISL